MIETASPNNFLHVFISECSETFFQIFAAATEDPPAAATAPAKIMKTIVGANPEMSRTRHEPVRKRLG